MLVVFAVTTLVVFLTELTSNTDVTKQSARLLKPMLYGRHAGTMQVRARKI
jgi:hypothetical protein